MAEGSAALGAAASVLAVSLVLSFNLGRYRKSRAVRALGLQSTTLLAVVLSLLGGFVLASLLGGLPCDALAWWGCASVALLARSALGFVRRLQRLYRRQSQAGLSKPTPSAAAAAAVPVAGAAGAAGAGAAAPAPARLARLWLRVDASWWGGALQALLPLGALASMACAQRGLFVVPVAGLGGATQECGDNLAVVAVVTLALVLLYAPLVAGAAQDLSASFTSDDALGLRRALSRLAATLALGALALCAALACALAGQLSLAQGWAVALPFVAGAQVQLVVAPWLRAAADEARTQKLLSETGVNPAMLGTGGSAAQAKLLVKAKSQEIRHLQAFIMTPEGFEAVSAHLKAELGLETLLFLIQATSYATEFQAFQFGSMLYEEGAGGSAGSLKRPPGAPRAQPPSPAGAAGVSPDVERGEGSRGEGSPGGGGGVGGGGALKVQRLRPALATAADSAGADRAKVVSRKDREQAYQRMLVRCREIHAQFISARAEMQVNLPSRMTARFAGIAAGLQDERAGGRRGSSATTTKSGRLTAIGVASARRSSQVAPVVGNAVQDFIATPDIFDDCILEVLSMLFYDSFSLRFLKKEENRRLWSLFLKQASLDDAAAAEEEETSMAADVRKGLARQATSLRLQLQSKLAGAAAPEPAGAAALAQARVSGEAGDDAIGRKLALS
jgi:hypothetical protein